MTIIREVSFDDYENIRNLAYRYDMPFKSYDDWQHLWNTNPAIKDIKSNWTKGWVLETDNKKIVGHIGNIPIAYELNGKRLIAAANHAWIVDSDYRSNSILLLKNYLAQKKADFILCTTANEMTSKVFTALKVPKVPANSYNISLIWFLNYQKFISYKLTQKGFPFGFVSYPLAWMMLGLEKIRKKNRFIKQINREISFCDDFDERFDIFWEKLKKANNRLLCVRSSQYLKWHFKYAIMNKKLWIAVSEKKSGINGYAIFLILDSKETGLSLMRLADLQTLDNDPKTIMEMISSGIIKGKKEGIYMLETLGFNHEKRNVIEGYSPYKRKLSCWPLFYKTNNESLSNELANPEIWDPCLFDGDSSL